MPASLYAPVYGMLTFLVNVSFKINPWGYISIITVLEMKVGQIRVT